VKLRFEEVGKVTRVVATNASLKCFGEDGDQLYSQTFFTTLYSPVINKAKVSEILIDCLCSHWHCGAFCVRVIARSKHSPLSARGTTLQKPMSLEILFYGKGRVRFAFSNLLPLQTVVVNYFCKHTKV